MRLLAIALVLCYIVAPSAGARSTSAPSASGHHIPVYAYFYQWYDRGSWDRAKKDLPLAGKYSSDDPHVLRSQVRQAQAAGIDGFLTSWKSTPTLNRRLTLLLNVAADQHLDVGVVYEALDFYRQPLPIATVKADLIRLVTQWGPRLHSSYGRPVIIWTGTDQYSLADVRAVRSALGDRAYLLAASKSVAGYERVAGTVDGEAYYWSSANPRTTSTQRKMRQVGAAVHRHGGIWIAPAASGFDGTTLGHTRIIDRGGGQTLSRSLDNAFQSKPDGVGVISWNEWSENTYIEPGERYGSQELNVLRTYVRDRDGGSASFSQPLSRAASRGSWSGLRAVLLLAFITASSVVVLSLRGMRPRPQGEPLDPVRRGGSDEETMERQVTGTGATRSDASHTGYLPAS